MLTLGLFFTVKLVLYCSLRFTLLFLCTLVSCYAWQGFPMSSLVQQGLGGYLGLSLDPCVCALCVVWLVVLIFSFLLFLVVSCCLVVWLSSVHCSSCVLDYVKIISNSVLSGIFLVGFPFGSAQKIYIVAECRTFLPLHSVFHQVSYAPYYCCLPLGGQKWKQGRTVQSSGI